MRGQFACKTVSIQTEPADIGNKSAPNSHPTSVIVALKE
jgi:hypothetical protein